MVDPAHLTASRTGSAPIFKTPPYSEEAEQSVLGGLMLDNRAWDRVAEIVNADDFYNRDHREIFRAIASLAEQSRPYDVITLREKLQASGTADDAGSLAYLADLARNTPSAANIVAYAEIVRERAILRSLIEIGTDITDSAFNTGGRSASDLVDAAEQRVFEIAEHGIRAQSGFRPIKSVLVGVMERIEELFKSGSAITGVPTGFTDLDAKTSGLQRSDLIIIAGRPSMGKTSFAMNICERVAVAEEIPVAVFSMEMPAEQLVMRLLSSWGRIDQTKLRNGRLDDDDWPRLTSALSVFNESHIFIDDSPGLSPTELRARCRRLKREHGLGLVVIDYLQLMQSGSASENRANEISEISRALKALAKELSVPVIALSQLNRSLEQRTNKRPVMSDLRESGAIEQDADVILFIYRDEVYNEDTKDRGKAEIIIGKQRNGPTGVVSLTFLGQHTRFENFTEHRFGGYDEPV